MSTDIARFVIHRGRDPFTPPQYKIVYVKDSFGIPWPVKKERYMNSEIVLIVKGPDEERVRNAFNSALQTAALKSLAAGLIAGFANGGVAGLNTAAHTFITELDGVVEATVGEAVDTSYEVNTDSEWSSWA
jgi:hypothetical protein